MQKISLWVTCAAVGIALAGPAFAADAPAASSASGQPSTPATQKPIRTHHLIGEVVSVDQAAKTLTVKHGSSKNAKDMTFMVETDTVLNDLKPGDHVKIGYVNSSGHLTATTITKNEHTAKK